MGTPSELTHLPGGKSHTGSCDRILRGRGRSKPSPSRVWAGICRKELLDQLSQIQ